MIMYSMICIEVIIDFLIGVVSFMLVYDMDVVGIIGLIMCLIIVSDGVLIDIVILIVIVNNINDNILMFG